ncbi:MAG: D-glycero-beta-D-manno-heptose 1,7-bisphosphate 7-phosphatase [bacterium]
MKAIFLDRDGTINEDMGYLNHIDRFILLPRSIEAIKLINKSGFKAVVVTNQAGLGMGYFSETLLEEIHIKLKNLLEKSGAYLDGIYHCPHHPNALVEKYKANCECRKPRSGMLLKASRDIGIDLQESFMIGDKIVDVELAHGVGAKGIMVKTGYGKGEYEYSRHKWKNQPDYIADDLYEAVKWILDGKV